MSTIDFDVNLISKINYRPSYKTNSYVWREEETVPKYKRFLLFFKVKDGLEIKPAGFYEKRNNHYIYSYSDEEYYYIPISEESLILYGYAIKGKEVWNQASVEVSLGYKSTVHRRFNTDDEAKAWIEYLKVWSNKQFETIEYGN